MIDKKSLLLGWALLGVAALLMPVGADDEKLKEGEETPRYPNYTYEEETPTETWEVPGSSSGLFFEQHQYGDPFIGRWQADYLNYGWKDYENYRLNTTPYLRTYDTFGNFIADGYEIFSLQEYRTRTPQLGSLGRKGQFYQNWLRHLVIADDAYGGWNTRLMVGDFIHTTFTPLTLDMTSFNGVRFDAISTGHQQLTLIVSRISDPLRVSVSGRTDLGVTGLRGNVDDGAYLLGGHWENNVGEALVLGATYVNVHRFDGKRGVRTNSRKGLAPQNTVPQTLIVRFEDDSPSDGVGGAALFEIVARISLAPEIDGEEATVIEVRPSSIATSPGAVQFERHVEVSGFFRNEDGFNQANFVDYIFDVDEGATDVEFAALVANDYKISMRQTHFFVTDPARGSGENRETAFATVRRAEGNVIDMSNKDLIHFDYGLATGVEVMGVNGKLSIPGLDIHGEIVKSNNYLQYPTVLGRRSKFDDSAGYLTIAKDLPGVTLGAELFSIGPKFTSYNPHPESSTDPLGEVFFFNEARQQFYRGSGTLTSNPYYVLVDDNDNMLYNERPDNWLAQGNPFEGNIFPFFDLDQDGHQDTNRNRNAFADYDEPFLMYFTDPEEFYFGDDYNNNFVTDAWEDDQLSNYPYYKDERGKHFSTTLHPSAGVSLKVGRYDVEQIAAAGDNEVTYGRLDLDRTVRQVRVRWQHETKDIEDNIRNDYTRYRLREGIGGYTANFVEDRLEARDSFVNRGLIKVEFWPLDKWYLEGKFRYELNHQRQLSGPEGILQEENDIDFFGSVFRTHYQHRWGNLSVQPRFKLLYRQLDRTPGKDLTIEELQIIPILRADYQVTSQSQLRLGLQGIPGLKERRRDFVDRGNDSDRVSWTLMWFSESEYEGYRIGTEIGVLRREIDFDEANKQDTKFTRFFIRMVSAIGGTVR